MELTLTQNQAVWVDLPQLRTKPFTVNICRLDLDNNREIMDYLERPENEKLLEGYDNEVFYYTNDEADYLSLFDPEAGHDFYLLPEEND